MENTILNVVRVVVGVVVMSLILVVLYEGVIQGGFDGKLNF